MNVEETEFAGSTEIASDDPTRAVITVRGELDLATAGKFADLLDAAIDRGAIRLTIDLGGLDFIDAGGLGVIARAAVRLQALDGEIELKSPSALVSRICAITELANIVRISAPSSGPPLALAVAGLASAPLTYAVLDAALNLVVTMAQAVVRSADGVSITLPRHGHLGTVASSNDVVLDMDHDQYDTGEGPCLDAAIEGRRFHIDSLDNEQRWPAFVPRARARGIETILSTPLMHADAPVGALNIYARKAGAFEQHEKDWADLFAEQAATVVTTAHSEGSIDEFARRIQDALSSRELIAQAQGVIMAREGLSAAAAYHVLRRATYGGRRPMREVAGELVRGATGGTTPRVAQVTS